MLYGKLYRGEAINNQKGTLRTRPSRSKEANKTETTKGAKLAGVHKKKIRTETLPQGKTSRLGGKEKKKIIQMGTGRKGSRKQFTNSGGTNRGKEGQGKEGKSQNSRGNIQGGGGERWSQNGARPQSHNLGLGTIIDESTKTKKRTKTQHRGWGGGAVSRIIE